MAFNDKNTKKNKSDNKNRFNSKNKYNSKSRFNNNRKAQITAILLLAFVILSTASLYFLLRSTRVEKQFESEIEFVSQVSGEAKPIAVFVGECIKGSAVPAIKLLGLQGGDILQTGEILKSDYGELSYGYLDSKNLIPTIEAMSAQLASYMDTAIKECANFARFEQQGYAIEKGNVTTHVDISGDKIIFNVEYPLKIAKGSSVSELKDYRQVIKIAL